MPLAWFSEREYEVYHVCLNCRYRRFVRDTLHIGPERDIQIGEDLRQCEICELLTDDPEEECLVTDCYDEVEKRILQYGRSLVVKRYGQ